MPMLSAITQWAHSLFAHLRRTNDAIHAAHDLDSDADAEESEPETEFPELDHEALEFEPLSVLGAMVPAIKDWGVWAGARSLANPRRDVAFAKSIGITTIHIIVNDHSKRRAHTDFTIRDRAKIIRLANLCHANGLAVVLMSWLQPHKTTIEQAAGILIPLMGDCRARMLCFDLEEPFTCSDPCPVWGRDPYEQAGALIGKLFGGIVPLACTGIRYAPVRKLGPVMEHCAKKYVQSYSTNTSGASPITCATKGYRRWSRNFGPGVVSALAAYRQTGIKKNARSDFTVREALFAAFGGAARHGDEVALWVLDTIRFSPEIAHAIADASGRGPVISDHVTKDVT